MVKNKGLKKKILQNIADKRGKRKISRNKSLRRRRIKSKFIDQAKKYGRERSSLENVNKKETLVEAPCQDFRLLENTDEVIKYLQKLKTYRGFSEKIEILIVDLRRVTNIDIGAICILLSVIEELSLFKINLKGNFPFNADCERIIMQSGFLNHVKRITGESFTPHQNHNLIVKQGRDITKNREIGEAIKNAVFYITGKEAHYHPVYSIVQEINGNAVEHAYDEKKHWFFGFNHDKDSNKVIFTFADNGFGILKTLRKKISQEIFDKLHLRTDGEILKRAFERKYGSRHKEHDNRNKGLPLLLKIQNQKEVKNLMVITNKVSLQLEKGSIKSLTSEFSGTFYYWELDLECIKNEGRNN